MEWNSTNMKKEIKDYLHFYIGCKYRLQYLANDRILNGRLYQSYISNNAPVQLLLRPLQSMTEGEAWEIWRKVPRQRDHGVTNPKCAIIDRTFHADWSIHDWAIAFPILLSKGFDLFNLIQEGLAIDSTTVKN